MATTARFRKQVPTDVWSVRERLALACSVMRSGDQNWVSVSRAIKPFGEPNRPSDWFSQKNCALQYSDLLEKVETPKRKRADRGETETPGDQIVRKLTIERIEELKRIVQEEQQKYTKLKREVEAVRAGAVDDRLAALWQEMQQQKQAAHDAALAAQQRAPPGASLASLTTDDSGQVRASAAAATTGLVPGSTAAPTAAAAATAAGSSGGVGGSAARSPGKMVPFTVKRPQAGFKMKFGVAAPAGMTEEAGGEAVVDTSSVKVEEGVSTGQSIPTPSQLTPVDVKPKPTPPSSPLLSSLLQNKHELQRALAAQQAQMTSPVARPQAPSAGSETKQASLLPSLSSSSSASPSTQPIKTDPLSLPIPTIDVKEEPVDLDLAAALAQEEALGEDQPSCSQLTPGSLLPPPASTAAPALVVASSSSQSTGHALSLSTSSSSSSSTSSSSSSSSSRPSTPVVTSPVVVTVKSEATTTPSIGAPTLSRLLVSPSPSSSAPLKLSTTLATAPPPPPPSQRCTTTTTTTTTSTTTTTATAAATALTSRTQLAPVEGAEETRASMTTTPEPLPTPTTPTTPSKKDSQKQEPVLPQESGSLEAGKAVAAVLQEDEPASPASSIVSNETESGSSKGVRTYGRRGGRRGKGGRRISQRITRGRLLEDDKAASSGKPSEAESSDEEGTQVESDEGTSAITPKMNLSISESVPNSPASLSQCDTEDEKAYRVWKKSIMLVWQAAANHKYANVFLHPVTNEIAPGYLNVVYRPMDLSLIKKNIESGALRTTAEFQRDMMLMFTNAIMYNNSDHDVYNMAVEMYNDVMVHIEQYVNTQMMVQSEGPKILRPSRRSEASMSDKEDDIKKRKSSTDTELHGGKSKKRK